MNYYKSLKLDIEPFSNSPDPDLFFPSKQHAQGLQWLEIGVRLKRGLHVVIGDIGTGKTTICRKLLQGLISDESVSAMLILDPGFSSAKSFLQELHFLFTGNEPNPQKDERALKETLKSVLFKRSVDNNELLVLVIDEGQKLSDEMLEVLRELLNYETNKEKLLQIIIFGQKELTTILDRMPNLKDRINKQLMISPLTREETAEFIQFRLRRAATSPDYPQFSNNALVAIFKATKGYPRRIVTLCHQIILQLATAKTNKVTARTVKNVLKENTSSTPTRHYVLYAKLVAATALVVLSISFLTAPNHTFFAQLRARLLPATIRKIEWPSYALPKNPLNQATEKVVPKKILKPTVVSGIQDHGIEVSQLERKQKNSSTPSTHQPSTNPPQLLGVVKLNNGSSLSKLIIDVYGAYSKAILQKILSVNPQITRPNTIAADTPILLPSLDMRPMPNTTSQYWLEIGRTKQLPEALTLLKDMNKFHTMFRIVCAWDAKAGLHFPVILRTVFTSKKDAQEVLRVIPSNLQYRIKIVQYPEPETLYCSSI